jgi:hypothetical protein
MQSDNKATGFSGRGSRVPKATTSQSQMTLSQTKDIYRTLIEYLPQKVFFKDKDSNIYR